MVRSTDCQLPNVVWNLDGGIPYLFANTYLDIHKAVVAECINDGKEPMVSVGYDIYTKNISQGKEFDIAFRNLSQFCAFF